MNPQELEALRYPIGRYKRLEHIDQQQIRRWIDEIDAFPQQLRKEVESLSEEQLDTPYRPD